MSKYLKKIVLDFGEELRKQYVWAKQYDDRGRLIEILMYSFGKKFVPDPGTKVQFRALKPDGKFALYDAELNAEESTITVTLTEQVLAAQGRVAADVILQDAGGATLSTASFYIQVAPSPVVQELESTNEWKEMQDLLDRGYALTGDYESALYHLESIRKDVEQKQAAAASSASSADSARQGAESAATESRNAASASSDSAEAAKRSATDSQNSADLSKSFADKAEQAAGNSGYMAFDIDEATGELIFERTANVDVDFTIEEGDLILHG